MYYGNMDERKKAAKKLADVYREAAGVCMRLKPIIEQFDGKVYNVRFDRAVKEAVEKTYVSSNQNFIEITHYGGNKYISVLCVKKEKRIDAAAWVDKARETRENLLKRAASIERTIENADTLTGQIAQLQSALKAIRDSVDYEAGEIFGLNVYMR